MGPDRLPTDVLLLQLTVTARFTHPAGQSRILDPVYSLFRSRDQPVRIRGVLFDNGQSPDATGGDSVYTATATLSITRSEIGLFFLELWAEDKNGFRSNTALLPLTVARLNRPPALQSVQAPDTVAKGGITQVLQLTAAVTDDDGLADIRRVIFNSFRPDNSPSSGNPFSLFDDGDIAAHGDQTAGDGVYNLLVTLPASADTGRYRFEFQAFDRSNAASAVITKFIQVRP